MLGRLLGGAISLLVALLLLGVAAEQLGDPVARQLGPEADAAARATLRAALGLDLPLLVRLLRPFLDLLRGDLGTSAWLRRPAVAIVADALPVTLSLAAIAWPLGVAGGVVGGAVLAACGRGWSRAVLLLLAAPGFVVAILAMEVFSSMLGWAPAAGFDGVRSLVLPALLLGGAIAVKLALLLQGHLREQERETWLAFARARNLPPRRVWMAYRLLPAAGLVARFGALHAGYLLGGALVVEVVFALPGLGRLAVLALLNRDLTLLRAAMLAAGTGFLVARFVSDAAQAWLDPRPVNDAG